MTDEQKNLWVEIVERHADVVYTYKAHLKMVDRKKAEISWLKNIQIALTAITTVGLPSVIFVDKAYLPIILCATSALSLALNLILRGNNYETYIKEHKSTASKLWELKAKYISLITDFEFIDEKSVRRRRDELLDLCAAIYRENPETDKKGYKAAKKAIKKGEECSYDEGEAEKLISPELRKLT